MRSWGELFHPDVIMRSPEGWPEPGPQVGREAVMRFIEQLRDAWHTDTLDVIGDFVPVADHVVVRFVWRGVSRGPDSNRESTGVYTVRNGMIFGLELFWDHAEALESVGASQMLPRSNVDVARSAYDAWNRDDFEGMLAVVHPEIEWRGPGDLFLGMESVYRGHAGLREWWNAAKEPWEYFKSHIERTLEQDDKVVAVVRFDAVGRESGVEVGLPFVNLIEVRDGLVVKFDAFYTIEEALEAAGMSE